MKTWLPLLLFFFFRLASGSDGLILGPMESHPGWTFEEVSSTLGKGKIIASKELGGTTGRVVLAHSPRGQAILITHSVYMDAFEGRLELDLLPLLIPEKAASKGQYFYWEPSPESKEMSVADLNNGYEDKSLEDQADKTSIAIKKEEFTYNLNGGVSNKGLHATATSATTATNLGTSVFRLNPSLSRFHSLRFNLETLLEIQGSIAKEGSRQLGLNGAELASYLKKMKETGFEAIVLSFPQKGDVFFYKPTASFTYLKGQTREKSKVGPDQLKNSLRDGKDLLSVFFAEAEANQMSVFLGLSIPGDPLLLQDLGKKAEGLSLSWPESAKLTLKLRTKRAVEASIAQAKDLLAQYGKKSSFRGWYLGPPSVCMDQSMKYLAPVAAALRGMESNKKIVALASLQARVCDPKTAPRSILLKENEKFFDVISYQDGIEGVESPEKGLAAIPSAYAKMAAAHQKTSIAYWLEVQSTHRKGPCLDEADECPGQASALAWSFVSRQLATASALVNDPSHILWSGGLSVFNIGENTELLGYDTRFRATDLTQAYRKYLNLSSEPEMEKFPEIERNIPHESGSCTLTPESTRKDGRVEKLEEEFLQASSSKSTAGMVRLQDLCLARANQIVGEECLREVVKISVTVHLLKFLPDGTRKALEPLAVVKECGK